MGRAENRNHGFCRCSASFTTPGEVPVLDVQPIRAISPFPRPEFRGQSRDHSGGCSAKHQVSEGKIIGADGQSFSVGNEQNIFSMRSGHIENQRKDFPRKNEPGENLREGSIPAPNWNARPAVVTKAEYFNPGEFLSHAKMHGGSVRVEQPSQVGGHPPLTPEANTQSGNAMGLMDPLLLQQNAKDVRSAFAKSLKRFKDLTVLGSGSTPETCDNMANVCSTL